MQQELRISYFRENHGHKCVYSLCLFVYLKHLTNHEFQNWLQQLLTSRRTILIREYNESEKSLYFFLIHKYLVKTLDYLVLAVRGKGIYVVLQ